MKFLECSVKFILLPILALEATRKTLRNQNATGLYF